MRRRLGFFAVLAALIAGVAVGAQRAGELVVIDTPVSEDLYAAGRSIELLAAVDGDVVAAGQSVIVAAPVSGDLLAAGERVVVRGAVGDDARLAGRLVRVSAQIADHLVAAGQEVELGPESRVGAWAWLAGETVIVHGTVTGDVSVVARRIVITGQLLGRADLQAESIELREGARVAGDLVLRSEGEPRIAPGAVLEGEQRRLAPKAPSVDAPDAAAGGTLMFAAVAVAGVVLYLLFPHLATASAETARARPWASLGLGLAVLAATPLLVAALLATVVAALLGVVLLLLYLCALVFGMAAGLFFLGRQALVLALRRAPGRLAHVLALLGAALVVALLQYVPVVGGLAAFVLLLLGLGSLQLQYWWAYRRMYSGVRRTD